MKTKISVTAVSDMHGFYPELPGGDLLIIAGDLVASDKEWQKALTPCVTTWRMLMKTINLETK